MQVDKITLKPTKFDGIELLCLESEEVPNSLCITKKYKSQRNPLGQIIADSRLDFFTNPSRNVIGLHLGGDVETYEYGNAKFVVSDNFKIDQAYLEHIYSVIGENWDSALADFAVKLRVLSFNDLAKVVKDNTSLIVRSWEELEKNCKINELLKFEHVKDRIDVVKRLFIKLLGADYRFNLISKELLKRNLSGDYLVYKSGLSYIDKFGARFSNTEYACDFNGTTVTMYPVIKDLMHDYEINKYKSCSNFFGTNDLVIKTTPEKLDENKAYLVISHDGYKFSRSKSTSSLMISGISSKSFVVNFNVTAEEVKFILSKFGKTKTGLKLDLMSKLGELADEVILEKEEDLKNYFNSNMVVQFNTAYREAQKPIIDGIDDSIINYVLYVYIKSRIHGSALFLKDAKNDLYNASNDFRSHNNMIEVKFLRLDEGIT